MMPWQMSYAASADLDNSELQTDVMRFMAILAFCLVAIFALVQSMPLRPEPAPVPVSEPVTQAPAPITEKPARPHPDMRAAKTAPPEQKQQIAAAVPAPRVVKPVRRVPRKVPAPSAAPKLQRQEQAPALPAQEEAPAQAPVRQGLSLQFESDAVLRSLVERGLVSLFAIHNAMFYRMAVTDAVVRFDTAPAPAQYHQMVGATVPGEVRARFLAQHGTREATWGVTLPAATTMQLRRFVQTNYAGNLVITADGGLALAGDG